MKEETPSSDAAIDHALELEKQHATLVAEYEALKKRHADFITKHEYLQESFASVKASLNEKDSQLRDLESSAGKDEYIKNSLNKIQELEDLIANQEQQMEIDRVAKANQEQELRTLRPLASRATGMRDELQELKNERDTLARKANTVDHFQKKLEMMSRIESENNRLRTQLEDLEANMKSYDTVMSENEKYKKTQDEYKHKFQAYEAAAIDHIMDKRMLESEIRIKDEEIAELRQKGAHDEEFITDLQDQIRIGGGPQSPDSPTANRTQQSLGEELADVDDHPNYALELSRLRAENQLLKSTTSNASLKVELEDSQKFRKNLEERFYTLNEKYTVGQLQLSALISKNMNTKSVQLIDDLLNFGPLHILTDDFYRNDAVAEIRQLYNKANAELEDVRKQLEALQTAHSSQNRELVGAKTDCKFSILR